jgi:hypothetical protein
MPYKIVQKKPSKESTVGIETAYRAPVLAATGAAATLPGVFGDIAKGVNDLVAAPITKHVFRQKPVPYEETYIGKALPTTAQHKKTLEENIPFLKPKNKLEEFTQDIAMDTAALFLPGKAFKMGKYAFSPFRSLSIATAANTLGKGAELWTGDKSKGDMTKSGSMVVLSLLSPTSASNISQNLYKSAQNSLPANASTRSASLTNKLTNLENKILTGRPVQNLAPSEKFVIDQIDKFRNLEKNGRISIESLVAQKRSLNEELQKVLFDVPEKAAKSRARQLATEISNAAKGTMAEYGQQNPQWWKFQQAADQAYGAMAQSNYLSRVLEKFMRGRPEALAHVFGIGIPAGVGMVSAPGAIGTLAAYQGTKLGTRIVKSPELRNHYAKVLGAAAADNPKLIHKELDELEEKIEKSEDKSKNKYKILSKK